MASRRRAWRRACGASALAFLAGCRSGPWRPEEKWSFAVTAEALDEMDRKDWSISPPSGLGSSSSSKNDASAYVALFIVLAPLALDVALLPVTAPHDWWIER